jgi:hypothetical protein
MNYNEEIEDLPVEETYRPVDPMERMARENPGKVFGLIESGMVSDTELASLVGALGWMDTSRSTILAMQHLQHPDKGVRFQAMSALNNKMNRDAIDPGTRGILGQKIARLTAEGRLP